jgi:hypothetical protein
MFRRSNSRVWSSLGRFGALLVVASYASPGATAPRVRAATKAAAAQAPSPNPRAAAAPASASLSPAPTAASSAAPAASAAAGPGDPRPANEVRVRAAEKNETKAAVVDTDVDAGVKTYTFGAQEVEGRLRSPQILYFLRRVRAEFDPAPLGHRSFLLELSDTRRHPALK